MRAELKFLSAMHEDPIIFRALESRNINFNGCEAEHGHYACVRNTKGVAYGAMHTTGRTSKTLIRRVITDFLPATLGHTRSTRAARKV